MLKTNPETGAPLCEIEGCEKPATVNYQDAFLRWSINEDGEYCSREEMRIVDAGNETNQHLCGEHDTPEHYG